MSNVLHSDVGCIRISKKSTYTQTYLCNRLCGYLYERTIFIMVYKSSNAKFGKRTARIFVTVDKAVCRQPFCFARKLFAYVALMHVLLVGAEYIYIVLKISQFKLVFILLS